MDIDTTTNTTSFFNGVLSVLIPLMVVLLLFLIIKMGSLTVQLDDLTTKLTTKQATPTKIERIIV